MAYEIFPTTAEHIVSSTDAVLLKNTGCDENFVAAFLDVPTDTARNALLMSSQLGLVKFNRDDSLFYPVLPFSTYVVTSREQQKSAVVRVLLEQYEPYKLFKNRLMVTGLVHTAAEQVRVYFGLTAHRDSIKDTLTSLGTYAQSLVSEGAGLYRLSEIVGDRVEYLLHFGGIASDREKAEIIVRKLIGMFGKMKTEQCGT